MWQMELNLGRFRWAKLAQVAAVGIFLTMCLPGSSVAQQPGQETFSSPEEALNAFIMAAKNNDEKTLLEILGPEGKQVISSGDETQDAENRANIVAKYDEMHRLVKEPDGTTVIYIGAENWPMPIPLAHNGRQWYFDTDMGKKEILYRRVGRNELSAIRVCQELAAAEKEYASTHDNVYAEKIFSDEGQHNGLYWKVAEGEPESPIGPLVASAVAEGYTKGGSGAPTPYRGYYFHILTSQSASAPGGAKSYIVDGKMTGGFAFVAYPAEYRVSGVMTFIVGQDGVVYQKDLGARTEAIAGALKAYNLNSTWQKAEGQEGQTTAEQQSQ
jgi:hypothetical protein